jgi:hypothetical protein
MNAATRRVLTVTLGLVIIIAAIVGGWEVYQASRGPGSVTLDGALLNVDYAPYSPQPFGPTQNQTCGHCPQTYTGGEQVTVVVLWMNLTFPAVVYYNLTITSPIPFHEFSCSGSLPCPLTNNWTERNSIWTNGGPVGGVGGVSYPVELVVPNPAPSISGGFWILTVLQVNVVPT